MSTPPAKVLVVEDEAIVALDLQQQLGDLGYHVVGLAASVCEAIAIASAHPIDVVLMDIRLKGQRDGIEGARELSTRWRLPVVFLTSHSDERNVARAAEVGAYGYLTKPFQLKEVRAAIEVALAKSRLERQLRESDQWFASTLRCLTDGLVVTDSQARVKLMNPSAERLTGWTNAEAASRTVGEVIQLHMDDPATDSVSALDFASRSLESQRSIPVVHGLQLRSRRQHLTTIDAAAGPVLDDDGHLLGSLLVLRDAGERVANEARLRASEERFRSAFDHAPLGMVLVSPSGELLQCNAALIQLSGRSTLGSSLRDLLAPDVRGQAEEHLRGLRGNGSRVAQFETSLRTLQPPYQVHVLISASWLELAGCYLLQCHDLTERRAAAARLAELAQERLQREASEAAIDSNQRLFNRVSHELRTPLNAVIGFAQLLEMQPSTTPETQSWVRHIRDAGHHLLELVTDLMDMNRAQSGQLNVQIEAVTLAPVVHSAIGLVSVQATGVNVRLLEANLPDLTVLADSTRLRQVLLNLLSNAVKYNRSGGQVRVSVTHLDPSRLTLAVEDTGHGMSAEQLAQLFQPFNRLGAERTSVPGVGLGLVITRSLVHAMQGELAVTSVSGVGTTVTVTLLREPPHEASAPVASR
jgi:PAS domain S-box-containing protein